MVFKRLQYPCLLQYQGLSSSASTPEGISILTAAKQGASLEESLLLQGY